MRSMERIVNKARSFKEAEEWDRRQQLAMTPGQRIAAARILQLRVFGQAKDIRACRKTDVDLERHACLAPTHTA